MADTHTIPNSDGELFKSAEGRRLLMERYGSSRFPYSGVNEDGEQVLVSISTDSIVINTFQGTDSGGVRTAHFDGTEKRKRAIGAPSGDDRQYWDSGFGGSVYHGRRSGYREDSDCAQGKNPRDHAAEKAVS